jgi:hypothetical protein
MDIKERLRREIQATLQPQLALLTREELREIVLKPALAEIERFEHDLEVAKDLVRVLAPTVNTMTRHTITLAQAIPELKPGDSLVLQILPTGSQRVS